MSTQCPGDLESNLSRRRILHGRGRIQREIQQDLGRNTQVPSCTPNAAFEPDFEFDIGELRLCRKQLDDLMGHLVERNWTMFDPRRTREVEQLPQNHAHSLPLLRRAIQTTTPLATQSLVTSGHVEKGKECAHRIADFVRHSGRQATHHCQSLCSIEPVPSLQEIHVRRPQFVNRLLQGTRSRGEGFLHFIECRAQRFDLPHAFDRNIPRQPSIPDFAYRVSEPVERADDSPLQERDPEESKYQHIDDDEGGDDGSRNRRVDASGHDLSRFEIRNRKSNRSPGRARLYESLPDSERLLCK